MSGEIDHDNDNSKPLELYHGAIVAVKSFLLPLLITSGVYLIPSNKSLVVIL